MSFAATIWPEFFTKGLSLGFRRSEPGNLDPDISELIRDETAVPGIRCPLCKWRPLRSSRWVCSDCGAPEYFYDGCGTAWNTFETRGKCPGCLHQWEWTSCLSCWAWSRHENWYEAENN